MKQFVNKHRVQRGFTLIELMIVLALIAILAAIGLPMVKERKLEGQAPETAKAVQMAITKLRNNRDSGGTWTGAANAELVAIMNSDSRVTIVGPDIFHGLGDPTGKVVFAAGNIAAANDSGSITVDKVNGAACPSFANALKNFANTVKVNAVMAKAAGGAYNGPMAQTACTAGDTNTLVFQFN